MFKHVSLTHVIKTSIIATSMLAPQLVPAGPDGLTDQIATDDNSMAVLIYHRFGDSRYPSTNIRLEQFEQQLRWLKDNDFNFPSLDAVVDAQLKGETLPGKNIIFTVDDGYQTIADEGWPRLKAAGIPMALFISTDPVDANPHDYMTWDTIRRLRDEGVTIGHHGASHMHMANASLEAIGADIDRANARFQEELGTIPDIFAWPYGEYSIEARDLLAQKGIRAAFAQFSAALGPASNAYSMPRFAINETYGDMDRFSVISSSLAMPVTSVQPESPLIMAAQNPPHFSFTVSTDINADRIACFPSNSSRAAELEIRDGNQIVVHLEQPFPQGRSRINCTAPAKKGRYYWFGRPFFNYSR